MPARNRRQAGLSLLETAALISLVATLLAAAVPTFLRKLRLSKVTEATSELERLHHAAAAYFVRYHRMPSGQRERECVPEPAGPTPAAPSQEPVEVDFGADETPGAETWKALGFQPDQPVRYRYSLLTAHAGCAPRERMPEVLLTLRAEGDLDGDGTLSTFERDATASDGELKPVGVLRVRDRTE